MKIALGTAQFGLSYGISNEDGKTSQAEVKKILKYANDVGITCLDTAREYGGSEEIIGITNNNFNIITKIGEKANVSDIDISLKMLQRNHIYGGLIHNTDVLFKNIGQDIYKKLAEYKECGKVKKIGVSVYTPEETNKILDNFDIDIIQIPSSILDQRFVNSGTIKRLKEKNIEIHIRSIFLQGLYFMEKEKIPSFFSPILDKITGIDNVANYFKITKMQLVVGYAKSLNADKIVVGINNLNQLMEIVDAYNSPDVDIDFERFSVKESLIDPRSWNAR